MEGDNFNQTGISEGNAMPPRQSPNLQKETSGGGNGAFIGAIIVIILLIIAGVYVWKKQDLMPTEDVNMEDVTALENDISNLSDPSLEALILQASDDSIESIETDVKSTNLENIDDEINVIEEELLGL